MFHIRTGFILSGYAALSNCQIVKLSNLFFMSVEIIPYRPEHKSAFYQLNLEWLDHYGLTESHDLEVLSDPTGTIIDRGGHIWMAVEGEEPIGSAALMKEHEGVYELAKMAVAPSHRGQGISKLLISTCIKKAKEIGAKKLILYSNHQLKTALSLYEKNGFVHIPVEDSPFLTADVKMELVL
jgi:putative acetyltransferase